MAAPMYPEGQLPLAKSDPDVAAGPPAAEPTLTDLPLASIAWFGALLILLFATTLYDMAKEWVTLEDMGHGAFVPFIAAYVVWTDRARLLKTRLAPSWAGLSFVIAGFAAMVLGIKGADFFISRAGFIVALIGVIWTLLGPPLLARLAFPLFILLFMIRIPLFIYSQATFQLQILASTVAEHALTLLGIPVLRDGNVLELASQRLSVVEACSGIRSLMSLALLSLVYGFVFDTKSWMRWVLLACSIPIAIIANAFRVTLTGVISEVKKEFAEGIYHTLEGGVIFMVAVFGLILAHQTVNFLYRRFFAGGRQLA